MKAAIYARYSSDNQREESITAQLRASREYCTRKGYIVAREYTDEELSARTDNRPAFQEMIQDAKAGLFDVLICHKIDRFARDRYDDAYYKRLLKKAGVTVEYVEQNIDGSPESIILESVLVGMAEYYSKNLAREALKGMRENAYQARHNGGKPPLGYDVKNGRYVINEHEAAIVRLIFDLRAKGHGYGHIIATLNARGYTTKIGTKFGKNSLHDLLRNKKYIGVYTFGRVTGGRSEKRNNHSSSENRIEIPDALPAIIPMEIWNAVHARMEESKHAPAAHTAKEIYYLSGKIRCECGAAMVGSRVTSRGNKYAYYKCDRQHRQANCGNTRIKKEDIETSVIQLIEEHYLAEDKLPQLIAEFEEIISATVNTHEKQLAALEKQRDEATRKINNLLKLAEDGEIDDLLRQRLNENKVQRATAEAEINKILEVVSSGTILTTERLQQILSAFTKKDKSPDEIRAMVDTFIDYVEVRADDVFIKTRFALEWWRRGESNPCPKASLHRLLRAQSMV